MAGFDDDVFAPMHEALFDAFGVDATVQRGAAAPVPVRIVVNRGLEQYGEYGQVVARVTAVDMLVSQWVPAQLDVIAWVDRLGSHSSAVDSPVDNDGFVARAVLHG